MMMCIRMVYRILSNLYMSAGSHYTAASSAYSLMTTSKEGEDVPISFSDRTYTP